VLATTNSLRDTIPAPARGSYPRAARCANRLRAWGGGGGPLAAAPRAAADPELTPVRFRSLNPAGFPLCYHQGISDRESGTAALTYGVGFGCDSVRP